MANKSKGKRLRPLSTGDVIKTNPREVYRGCAVVFDVWEKTKEFHAMCHIGITSAIFFEDYSFSDLDINKLEIQKFDRHARVAPTEYVSIRLETCIGIYTRKQIPELPVIGNIDCRTIYSDPLELVVGNGEDGGWPLCGEITPNLGYETVITWRRTNDHKNLLKEQEISKREHEELLIR